MAATTPDVIYAALSADSEEISRPMEIESLCVSCEENGVTRLMCVRIPYYKAVILMSFECPHCGYHNNEIQSGEASQEHGTEIVLRVDEQDDLRRQLVKSEYASIEVPEIELTIPPRSQPAEITTVEGVLERVSSGLLSEQERRRLLDPESATKIDEFCARLQGLRDLKEKWTLKLHDPTGNCFIQNPDPLHVDPRCIVSHYHRNLEENKLLGFADDNDEEQEEDAVAEEWKSFDDAKHEVMHFDTQCPNCALQCRTLMKPTDIPYFDTVIVMATSCDHCGYKTNEVKAGGAIRDHGCKLEVAIKEPVDLARDVLKSDTCSLSIPALDLEVGPGALCSRFTTVEGMLNATKEQIESQSKFFIGDSASSEEKSNLVKLLEAFDDIVALKRTDITLVLDDPAGNSYIQSLTAPLEDPRLQKTFYTRSFEQNDELGINDMRVENYQELQGITEEEDDIYEHKDTMTSAFTEDEIRQELLEMGYTPTTRLIKHLRTAIARVDPPDASDDANYESEHPFSSLEIDSRPPPRTTRQGMMSEGVEKNEDGRRELQQVAESPLRMKSCGRNPLRWQPQIPSAVEQMQFEHPQTDALVGRAYERCGRTYALCDELDDLRAEVTGLSVDQIMARAEEQVRKESGGWRGTSGTSRDDVDDEEDYEEGDSEQNGEGASRPPKPRREPGPARRARTELRQRDSDHDGAASTIADTLQPLPGVVGLEAGIRPVRKPDPGRRPFRFDPVNRIGIYQQEWKRLPAPGEKKRLSLRWKIREQLLQRDAPVFEREMANNENILDVPPLEHEKDWSPRPYLD